MSSISIIFMCVALISIFVLVYVWVLYTKDGSEESIKKAGNLFSSILFWGVVVIATIVTLIYL